MKDNKLIYCKKFLSVRAIPSIVGLGLLLSVVMTVGLACVAGGYLLRAIRPKSRKKETPSDWYSLPGRFDLSGESPIASSVGPSI